MLFITCQSKETHENAKKNLSMKVLLEIKICLNLLIAVYVLPTITNIFFCILRYNSRSVVQFSLETIAGK